MDVCNNILYFIYILLVTITISSILICIFKNNENNSRYRSSLFIFYGIVLYHVFYGGKYNGIITSLFLLFIFIYVLYAFGQKKINLMAICRYIRSISIPLLIISICCLGAKLIIHKFNGDSWWINENNISNDISKWGDFATFFGGIFAFISILLAYRAFISQVNASRRTSFDATFTQIFAQHKILYDKAMQHNDSILFVSDYDKKCVKGNVKNNIFSICKNEYMKNLHVKYMYMKCYIPIKNIAKSYKRYDISKFWESFNERIGSSVSVDFKNYLKYIHNEVEFVASQPDDILDNDAKQRYIQLIQAQMNNDELFCYLINKVEFMYRHKSNLEEDTKTHAKHLRDFKFFIELCRGKSGHVDIVETMLRDKELNVSAFIDENWILKDKS